MFGLFVVAFLVCMILATMWGWSESKRQYSKFKADMEEWRERW